VPAYTINPPESEVDFEKLCLALLKRHWSRQGLERFAKRGEEQFGVDIFDTLGESPLYAAQCKLKEQWKSLEPAEIREEIDKAKTFPSKLEHYAILTTGKISGAAQLTVQAINQEHRGAGLFTIELFAWDKITELIRQYSEIEQQFYGGLQPQTVALVTSKLDCVVSLAEAAVSAGTRTEIDSLIDEARAYITSNQSQIAVLLLNQIQRTRGCELSDWHRFRILTNLGAANLNLGNGAEAAKYFLNARQFSEDELAITNEVLAYHLLLNDEETRERSTRALERFPASTRLRSLWIQAADPAKSYEHLLAETPTHMRKDAEVALALGRRALTARLIERAIEHAKDAVADKPKWPQAHLSLAQAYFAKIAVFGRSTPRLTGSDREEALRNSMAAADAAIYAVAAEGNSFAKCEALALKSDIALIQGHKEDGSRFARESFGADPTQTSPGRRHLYPR